VDIGDFSFKLKHLAEKLILYNKLKGLKGKNGERMFQYEKAG